MPKRGTGPTSHRLVDEVVPVPFGHQRHEQATGNHRAGILDGTVQQHVVANEFAPGGHSHLRRPHSHGARYPTGRDPTMPGCPVDVVS